MTPQQHLQLPAMHSSDQAEYVVVASGPTLTGLITLSIIAVVVVAIIVLIVVFRKRIAAGLRSAQVHTQKLDQQRGYTEQTAVYPPQSVASSVGLDGDDAVW